MKSITVKELHQKMIEGEELILIDVREPFEHEHFNLGGTNIPLSSVFENHHLFSQLQNIIIYCQKGIRSQIAIQKLEDKFGYQHLINLQGGVSEWEKKISNQSNHE